MIRAVKAWNEGFGRRRRKANVKNEQEPVVQGCSENPQNRSEKVANHFGIATRAAVVALRFRANLKREEVATATGVSYSEVGRIIKRAKERGFDPDSPHLPLLDKWFEDGSRSGRPAKATSYALKEVKDVISKTRDTRTLTLSKISQRLPTSNVSATSVWRLLRSNGYSKCKPTKKPGLTDAQKQARLNWCLKHKDWTLEDWKKVLWSDETSVIYGHRRGSERVWRTVYEANDKTCIRRRWKGFSEFMFWGCFSYDHKGPCHVWTKETAKEKAQATKELDTLNKSREAFLRSQWELSTAFDRQMRIHDEPSTKPSNKRSTKTSTTHCSSGSGVNAAKKARRPRTPAWNFNKANGL